MKHNRLLRNPGLKIASLVLAFLVWLVIINVMNPVTTRTFTGISVSVSGASYVESMKKSYRVADGYGTVSVTVRGNRKTVERLTAASIKANIDLRQIIDKDSDPVMVPVVATITGISSDAITVRPNNIGIVLEDTESKNFVVNATAASDTTPSSGYEVGVMTANPDTIKVKGPKSIVEKIDLVKAVVDVTGLSYDTERTASVQIIDKNGDALSDSEINFLTFPDEITVKINLYRVVTDVMIDAETSGKPDSGYKVDSIAVTPDTISVIGSDTDLEALKEAGNAVLISSESGALDISGKSSDQSFRVDITEFLPENIELAKDVGSTVVVDVKISRMDSISVQMETDSIIKFNVGDGLISTIDEDQLTLKVASIGGDLEELDLKQVGAAVDLAGLTAGTYENVPVKIELPDGYELTEDVTCTVVISEKEETDNDDKDS